MKTLLIDVTYTEETGKYWCESSVKNRAIPLPEGADVHSRITETCQAIDYMEFSYNGRPRSNIYVDTVQGAKPVGYTYRCKTQIEGKTALFTAWVTIRELTDFPIEIIVK